MNLSIESFKVLWKIQIFCGFRPCKVIFFKSLYYREMILDFYDKIDSITLEDELNFKNIYNFFVRNPYLVENLYLVIYEEKIINNKKYKLIYKNNNKLKLDVIKDNEYIYILLPNELF